MIESAKYTDPDHTWVSAILTDGVTMSFPVDTDDPEFRAILDSGVEIAEYAAPEKPPARLPKLLVLERLQAAGKFDAAHTALTSDSFMHQRWLASQSVDPEDADVRALLEAIGADIDVILACETVG